MTHVKAVTTVSFFCNHHHPLLRFITSFPLTASRSRTSLLKSSKFIINIEQTHTHAEERNMDRYRGESRTSSQTSELNGDQIHRYPLQDLPTESMSTEWTDEKHSLYLNSMEASFVNQLHDSLDLLGLQLQKEMSNPKLSWQAHYGARTPGQFKVLRRGCWQRVNLRRPESEVHRTNESRDFLRSPWIQHFRSVRKPQAIASLALRESDASQNGAIVSSGKKAVPSGLTEMSDQNFVDEDVKTEKANSSSSPKRMKTNASNGDHVVPTGKLPLAKDISAKKSAQK